VNPQGFDPGFQAVYLNREGEVEASRGVTWRICPHGTILSVLSQDPKTARAYSDDLVDEFREKVVIEAMDLLDCPTADITLFEFWRRARGVWVNWTEGPTRTTDPIYSLNVYVVFIAVRTADGPFETGGFDACSR